MELILEKTTIPSQLPRLGRPRLLARLPEQSGVVRPVISGRAGAGKTALATDFARICSEPVAWYKVDASDSDVRVFFAYLVPASGSKGLDSTNTASCHSWDRRKRDHILRLAETIVYELLEGEGNPLLIAIESASSLRAEWLVPFLCRFLPLLPRDVHVLITSRTLPPLHCGGCDRSRH